jgi:hypothetical protein
MLGGKRGTRVPADEGYVRGFIAIEDPNSHAECLALHLARVNGE